MEKPAKKANHRDGFSLLEIILAVGLLSLVSVYLLQVFVTSHRLNQQAADLDHSIRLANTILSLVEVDASGNVVLDHPDFQKAEWRSEEGQAWSKQWFDREWKPIGPPDLSDDGNIVYEAKVMVQPMEAEHLTQVDVNIDRFKPYPLWHQEDLRLYHLTVNRYIPMVEVSNR